MHIGYGMAFNKNTIDLSLHISINPFLPIVIILYSLKVWCFLVLSGGIK